MPLADIANALSGKPTTADVGSLNKKGINAAPFPKQYNPQLNTEAAAEAAVPPVSSLKGAVNHLKTGKYGGQ